MFVNGRGDMGRTPWLTQTDLLVGHEFKITETQRLRFEFNALNLFNQKTARNRFFSLNRGAGVDEEASAINLNNVNLFNGYDYRAMLNAHKTSFPAAAHMILGTAWRISLTLAFKAGSV